MSTFMLEVLTPDKTIFWGKAEALSVRAIDGELQVLAGHIPYINVLSRGELRFLNEENKWLGYKHSGGIIEVSKEKTSVLVCPS